MASGRSGSTICAGVPVRVVWRNRGYRYQEDAYAAMTFSEVHERAALTTPLIAWAVSQPRSHRIAVSTSPRCSESLQFFNGGS